MSEGWEVPSKVKTKYVLEWTEKTTAYDQRDGIYVDYGKHKKEFVTFDDLYEFYSTLKGYNIIAYRQEWIVLNKSYKKSEYRDIT